MPNNSVTRQAPRGNPLKPIADEIFHHHPQALPAVAIKLLQVMGQPNASAASLEEIIRTDPALAARALKIVNSARYAPARPIHSISHAVAMIGFETIRSLALEISLYNHILASGQSGAFDRVYFWRHCLSVAVLAKLIAKAVGYHDPEEAYTAGLLHDIGKIMLNGQGCMSYDEFAASLKQNSTKPLVERERDLIGLGHDEIGAYCCQEWGLPARIRQVIHFHHRRFYAENLDQETATLLSITAFANYLAWIQGIGAMAVDGHPIMQAEINVYLEIKELDLPKLLKLMEQQVQEVAAFYGFQLPSADQLRTALVHANINLSRLSSKYYFLQADLRGRLRSLHKLRRCMLKPHHSLDINRIIPSTLRELQAIFHYDRLFVLRINKNNRGLTLDRSRDLLSRGQPLPCAELEIKSADPVLSSCLRQRRPILLSRASSHDCAILDHFQLDELGLVPIVDSSKLLGLLGLDNHVDGGAIQAADLTAIKTVADELGMALENAENFKAIQHRSQYDGMTRLYNRQTIESLLKQAFKQAKASGPLFAVGLIDVDYFKKFNDNFGHQAGDRVLKLVAEVLRKFCRQTDKVGRWGGEEFLFMIDTACLAEAITIAERLRLEIEELGRLLEQRFPGQALTVSIGLSAYEASHRTLRDLVDCADQALYLAKNQGRNRVAGYQSNKRQAENR